MTHYSTKHDIISPLRGLCLFLFRFFAINLSPFQGLFECFLIVAVIKKTTPQRKILHNICVIITLKVSNGDHSFGVVFYNNAILCCNILTMNDLYITIKKITKKSSAKSYTFDIKVLALSDKSPIMPNHSLFLYDKHL